MDGKAIFTNNIPGGAFRGYGAPQSAFAAELHISQIAEQLDIDPITIRMQNCLKDGDLLPTQSPLTCGSSLDELIDICARQSGCEKIGDTWSLPEVKNGVHHRSGFGLAIGMKATGYGFGFPEGSTAKVELHGGRKIERVKLYSGAVDVGQGAHTVLVQIAAHELAISPDLIEIFPSDTLTSRDAGAAAASRLTFFAGNAVKLAAQKAMEDWQDENRPAIGDAHWESPPTTSPDPITGACIDNVSYSFAAQGVFVDVDMETGKVLVDKVITIQDVGKAVNPQKIEGQIEGAVVQALGWTLLENFVSKKGIVLSDKLSTYLIPTVLDASLEIESILIERPDPGGPYGVRGVGEVPFIPIAPAVTAAVKDATEIWFNQIPMTPEKVRQNLIVSHSSKIHTEGSN